MQLVQRLKAFPFHVAGVILFFISHGYTEYIGLIPLGDMLVYFVVNLAIFSLFLWFFYKKLKSIIKAGVLTTLIIACYLFYGAVQDTLQATPYLSWLSRYRYLVPGMVIALVLLYRYMRRSSGKFHTLNLYLNLLFILFIAFDLAVIGRGMLTQHTAYEEQAEVMRDFHIRDSICKPDIYLVVMDEYSGSGALQKYFNYNNGWFESFFREQGFWLPSYSFTNYSSTALVMASVLNMRYMEWYIGNGDVTVQDRSRAAEYIANSEVAAFLQANGYKIYNHSVFDVNGLPSRFETGLMPFKIKMITSKTLFRRMKRDLQWQVALRLGKKITWFADNRQEAFRKGNQHMLALTREVLEQDEPQPKFVYTHLMMPHDPFICDSTGKNFPVNYYLAKPSYTEQEYKDAYLQYLVYTSKVVTSFVRSIMEKTQGKAVVIVMSDHGLRELNVPGDRRPWLNTFNAVYLPVRNYAGFRDTISTVNQFRLVFNSLFDLQLPLLKDSCVVQ